MTVTSSNPVVGAYQPAHAEADTATVDAPVIDLAPAARPKTRVVLDRDLSPFDRLDPAARRRLLVRVLCELVAYDTPDEDATAPRLAG